MNAPQRDIRGVMITVTEGRLLLPNAIGRRGDHLLRPGTGGERAGLAARPDPLARLAPAAAVLLALRRLVGGRGHRRRQGGGAEGARRQSEAAVTSRCCRRASRAWSRCRSDALAGIAQREGTAARHPLDGHAQRRSGRRAGPAQPRAADRQGRQHRRPEPLPILSARSPYSAFRAGDRRQRRRFPCAGCAGPGASPSKPAARASPGRVPRAAFRADQQAQRVAPARRCSCASVAAGASDRAPAGARWRSPRERSCASDLRRRAVPAARARPLCSQADGQHAAPVRACACRRVRRRASPRCAR